MFNFSDLNIKPKENTFTGKKMDIDDILNEEIIVSAYDVKPSKKKADSDYLTLQIEFNKNRRVLFTGSKTLIDQITQVPDDKFPFKTKIKKNDKRLEFT